MKRLFSMSLIGILLSAVIAWPVAPSTKVEKEIQFSQKVKAGVASIGTGQETRVEVKLRDKSKLKGFIQDASESSFVVSDLKTGARTTVAYADVKQIKGNNL